MEQTTQELLTELNTLRSKFNWSEEEDKARMQVICDELVKRGVYPAQPKMGEYYTPLKMVEAWGAYWFEYKEPLNCPHCKTDLRDHEHGPPGKREIGIYSREYDRTMYFQCPDCGQKIDR